jgi:hypothetical protein
MRRSNFYTVERIAPSAICAAVIDHDHLKLPGQVRQFARDLLDGRGNYLFFVIGWQDDRAAVRGER